MRLLSPHTTAQQRQARGRKLALGGVHLAGGHSVCSPAAGCLESTLPLTPPRSQGQRKRKEHQEARV